MSDGQITVTGSGATGEHRERVDEVIFATGCRPDLSLFSELQLDLDPAVQAPRRLAPHNTAGGNLGIRYLRPSLIRGHLVPFREGLSLGQVGQRPFEMGYKSMLALLAIKEGKGNPKDPTYTGLDVCTPENVATCIGK